MIKDPEKKRKTINVIFHAGAASAVLFLVYSIASVVIMVFMKGGYPATADECFSMFRGDRLIALLRLDILSVIVIPFYAVLFFSIYTAVRNQNPVYAGTALFLILGGIIVFMSTVNLASIVNIAEKYLAADSPELKSRYLAACEGMLAGDMWINTGYVYRGLIIELGAIIFSAMMLRSKLFTAPVGWIGLVTHIFDFAGIIAGLWYNAVKSAFTYVAGPLYIIWFILLLIQFIRMPGRIDDGFLQES